HGVRRCWLAEPAESIRGGLGKIDPAGAEVGFPRLPDCLGILRPAEAEVPESRHDGQDHDDRGDPGPAAACRAVELPARSLRTRVASLGRCFRSHASLPLRGRSPRPVDRPSTLNNALAREKRSLSHSRSLLNYSNKGPRIPHAWYHRQGRFILRPALIGTQPSSSRRKLSVILPCQDVEHDRGEALGSAPGPALTKSLLR